MDKLNFIPCLHFVKRGVAKANPEKVQLTQEELAEIINQTKTELLDAGECDAEPSDNESNSDEDVPKQKSRLNRDGGTTSVTDDGDEFKFDTYDKEDGSSNALLALKNVTVIDGTPNINEESDSEAEDDIIKSDDNLILVGHVEGDASILDVYIYNENEDSLYVHHDLILPSFPLCIEWLDYDPTNPNKGNMCAIGSMQPVIDVWDLDIMDGLEPAFKLGKKKKNYGHSDAVLDIAWNHNFHHILASASVDKTVLLWDLDTGEVHTKLDPFTDKVQSLCWHALEAQTLLVGGCDGLARVFDCRQSDGTHRSWSVSAEIERTSWDPHNPFCFMVSTNDGRMIYIDCRNDEPLWDVKAHEKEVTGLNISRQCPGLLVTASSDGFVKSWDIKDGSANLVHGWDVKIGDIQCLSVCPENPFIVCSGGDNKTNNFKLLDLRHKNSVVEKFGMRQLATLVAQGDVEGKLEEMAIDEAS